MVKVIKNLIFLLSIFEICKGQLYMDIPAKDISFCSYRMNYTHYFGSNSQSTGSTGNVLLIRSLRQMQYELSQLQEDKVVFIIPPFLFANINIIKQILLMYKYISGIVVLEPDYCISEDLTVCPYVITDLPFFSEENICIDQIYYTFSKKTCKFKNMFGFVDYLNIDWPFPLIFLYRHGDFVQNIIDCYENYNAVSSKGQKCKMTIMNYTPHKLSVADCIERENDFQPLILNKLNYCVEVLGYNIYITFNKVKSYGPKSVILITTKMDSPSMFDTAATGAMELYPSVSLLMYMAGLFNSSYTKMKDKTDVLLAFLDNESYDDLGSLRLIYDLKTKQVSNGMANISADNILLIISITDFSKLKSDKLFLISSHCEYSITNVCKHFIDSIKTTAKKNHKELYLFEFDKNMYSDNFLKNIKVPRFIVRSIVKSDTSYKRSFLDRLPLKDYPFLKSMGKILAEAVLMLIKTNENPIDLNFNAFTPNDMTRCFYKISCPLLKNIIGPFEKSFYTSHANPFISQTFVTGQNNIKKQEYTNRLSYFVLKLMVYFFHISYKEDEDCYDLKYQYNFSIIVRDIRLCYITRIQAMRNFNPLNYAEHALNFTQTFQNLPIRMRSNVVTNQMARLFISVDGDLQTTAMVFTTLISSLCFVGSIFLYRSINIIIPAEIF